VYAYAGSTMPQEFPDQFAPFVSSPFKFDPRRLHRGTIVRLPLRRVRSTLSYVGDLSDFTCAV